MSFRTVLVTATTITGILAFGTSIAQADGPKFVDYAVTPAEIYKGKVAKPVLDTAAKREYRSMLRDGAVGKADFAGHYKMVRWGVGTGCQTGAVVDARSGAVTFLPAPSCMWNETSNPFYYKTESRLLVYGGQVGEDGPPGPNYFVFRDGTFTPLAGPAITGTGEGPTTSAGGTDASSTVDDARQAGIEPAGGVDQRTGPKGPQPDELRSMMFQAVSLAVFQPQVQHASENALSRIPLEQLRTISDMLLSTSMSFALESQSGEYALLYNWFADLLILVEYTNGVPTGVGLASADQLARDFYRPSGDKTAIETMLAARPTLLHALQRDLPHMAKGDIELVFNHFLVDADAGQRTRESILGMAALLKYALADQCWPVAKKFLAENKVSIAQTLHAEPEDLGELYAAGAIPLADGLAFAFSDAATNKRVGYLFVAPPVGKARTCQPHGVVTAVF